MHKLLIICGPTATGKTALAADVATKFNGELVSADSRQVYRGMDLTTGKDRPVSPAGRPDVPIWLYDAVDPDEEFSVSQWVRLAENAIDEIASRKKLPIVVGGTGLYIKALLEPLATIDIPPDAKFREKHKNDTVQELQNMISRGNMNDSDWNNPRRLIRKIEIASFRNSATAGLQGEALQKVDVFIVGLSASIAELDKRIDERLKKRIQGGMEKEAASLLTRYNNNLPSMSAIGLNEHAYARRQMTWFKKQKNIVWFDIMDIRFQENVIKKIFAWYTDMNKV